MKTCFYLLIILFQYIFSCETNVHLTECINNKRNIYFYKNCTDNNTVPSSMFDVKCGELKCPEGTYMTYSFDENKQVCRECPEKTFSTGTEYRICGTLREWSDEKIKDFKNFCFLGDFYDKNYTCTPWNVNKYGSRLVSGESNITDIWYTSVLSKNVKINFKGSVYFGYKKKTVKELGFYNGGFKFYIDDDEMVDDSNINQTDDYIEVKFDLEPGEYHFEWIFYYRNSVNNQVSMEIKWISFEGITDGFLECQKCGKGYSKKGSKQCERCLEFTYYDLKTKQCEQCEKDEFSYPNSYEKQSCMKKRICTQYDYNINCDTLVTSIENIFCLNDTIPNMKQLCKTECPQGYYYDKICKECPTNEILKNSTCTNCGNNFYSPRLFNPNNFNNFNFTNECSSGYSEYCEVIKGWIIRPDILITGNDLPANIELKLKKKIIIVVDKGYIQINYKLLNLKENEYFYIYINGFKKHINQNSTKIELNQGEYNLELVYKREDSVNRENALMVEDIIIYGSEIGSSTECLPCPEGTYNFNNSFICTKCKRDINGKCDYSGSVSDRDSSNDINQAVDCPDFTEFDSELKQCKLADYIHNKLFKSRFLLQGLKNQLQTNCNEESEICYQKFIGPIRDHVNGNIFFISIFDKDKINITDFSILNDDEDFSKGHLFVLINSDDEINGQYLRTNKGLTLKNNIKIMKNIGSKINKVYISKVLGNEGLAINYSDGDLCLSDTKLRYNSILYLTCDKNSIHTTPRYLGSINNNCTHVFELLTPYGCPSCIKKDVYQFALGCINSKQEIYYEDNYNCNIDNNVDYSKFNNKTYNNEDNVISKEMIEKNYMLAYYYKELYRKKNTTFINIPLHIVNSTVLNSSDDDIYVNKSKEEVSCNFYDNFDNSLLIIVIILPIVYFFVTICLVVYYCKYKRVRNQYQMLRNEVDVPNSQNI